MIRLRLLVALSPWVAMLALPVLSAGCPKPEEKKDTPAATGDDDDDKKSKDKKKKDDESDDDDDKGKKKKKKGDDDDDKPSTDDTTNAPHASSDAGPNAAPIPAACAPDAAGKLGAKPKLLASGGEPGVSIGVWAKNGESPLSTIGITIHADNRCYVDYVESHGNDPSAQWAGMELPKASIGASSGISERGKNAFVGFRVTIHEKMRKGGELHTDAFDRFYGYVQQEGQPYSCTPIAGEKTCAMYHKPLLVKSSSSCSIEKGGGPIDPLAQIKINAPAVTVKKPTTGGITLVVPSALADAGIPDIGLLDAGTCNGATCGTNAFLAKESEHVYVRVAAGKPVACDTVMGGPHVGDTWYFDDSVWKKR